MNGKIRLLIAAAQTHEVEEFTQLLRRVDYVMVIGEATSAQVAVQQALNLRPGVVLLDLTWQRDRTAGASTVRHIATAVPEIAILDAAAYAEMIESERKKAAVLAAGQASPHARPTLATGIRNGGESEADPAPEAKLTRRELDVLKLVAQGETDARIARSLGIHMTTVKKHVSRILAKFAVSSRAGATAAAYESGIFQRKV